MSNSFSGSISTIRQVHCLFPFRSARNENSSKIYREITARRAAWIFDVMITYFCIHCTSHIAKRGRVELDVNALHNQVKSMRCALSTCAAEHIFAVVSYEFESELWLCHRNTQSFNCFPFFLGINTEKHTNAWQTYEHTRTCQQAQLARAVLVEHIFFRMKPAAYDSNSIEHQKCLLHFSWDIGFDLLLHNATMVIW